MCESKNHKFNFSVLQDSTNFDSDGFWGDIEKGRHRKGENHSWVQKLMNDIEVIFNEGK